MGDLVQRVQDWCMTIIGHWLRTVYTSDKEEESGYYGRIGEDPCDVSSKELEAMRRRFNRVAVKYT